MSSIKWNWFIQTREGMLARNFFIKLTKDIAQDEMDKTDQGELKNGESEKEKVLLLNTKKGYWLYKIFQREECRTSELPIIHVVSDRFAQKQVEGSFWYNKIVYLVDDTLTRGYSLLETYELLLRWMNEEDIHPIVFALNERVEIEKNIASSTSDAKSSFWKSIKYYTKMSEEEMGYFCTCETKMMHVENIPYVIDLPYLKEACQSQKISFEVTLTKEQFTVLQQENELWKFHFNDYKLEYDAEGEVLQGFILETQDEQLLARTEKFILNYIITGTYLVDEEQKVHFVFVPFAIAHSVSMEAVKELWKVLLGEAYTNSVGTEGHSEHTNDNLWRRCYRECVYVMSMEIAERFKGYLENLTGIRLCYDYDILMEHFPKEFVEKAKEIENELMEDPYRICKAVESLEGIFSRDYSFQEDLFEDDGWQEQQEEYNEDFEGAVYDLILSEVEKRKEAFLANPGAGEKMAVLEYGEMIEMIRKRFSFRVEGERRYVFTRIIITFLMTSMCSGRIFVDYTKGMIKKGVRYGENSDLLLPFLDLKFYWAIVLLVEKEGKRAVLESYDRLVRRLGEKYRELGLCENRAAENRFFRNEQYFRMVLVNDFQIYNKYFYFEPYFKGMQNNMDMYYMKKIEEFVDSI